jgi:hypothetical protein
MMTLGAKRTLFTQMILLLVQYCQMKGFEVRFDKEHCNHHEHSLHYVGLAKDILLFDHSGYLTDTEDYRIAGEFWEYIGGSWGGRFGDGNHFSLPHGGMK